jgi:hypothetical protein
MFDGGQQLPDAIANESQWLYEREWRVPHDVVFGWSNVEFLIVPAQTGLSAKGTNTASPMAPSTNNTSPPSRCRDRRDRPAALRRLGHLGRQPIEALILAQAAAALDWRRASSPRRSARGRRASASALCFLALDGRRRTTAGPARALTAPRPGPTARASLAHSCVWARWLRARTGARARATAQ